MQRNFYLLLPLLLAGCFYNQTNIQGDYEDMRIVCQEEAEIKIHAYDVPGRKINNKDRNAELVTLFSDCMAKKGWQVATPKREIAGSAPLTGTQLGQNREVSSEAQPVAPVDHGHGAQQAAPVRDGAVVTEATPLSPSGSMPPLRRPVNPDAATYQPAPTGDVGYGTGPGRSF